MLGRLSSDADVFTTRSNAAVRSGHAAAGPGKLFRG